MDLPSILLYRAARVAIRLPDESLVTTESEERQFLYITQDGVIGGTGLVATYLMQPEMSSARARIIRWSMHPICNYVWSIKTDSGKLRVKFISPWQPFAQLTWFPHTRGSRCMATAYFAYDPGEVVVRTGPSGRVVGKATPTLFSGHGSPMTYFIEFEHVVECDLIVLFQPEDATLAPVLSQAFPRTAIKWDTQVALPISHHLDDAASSVGTSPDRATKADFMQSENGGLATTDARIAVAGAASEDYHKDFFVPLRADVYSTDPRPDRPNIDSAHFYSLCTASPSSTSSSASNPYADDPRHTPFIFADDLGAQQNAEDDRCIVVKPLF
ncbi:hypothetical protein CDEST_09243 [Colletotrichum destructivum]|uniref:Uncharacterized protein n=1 Tax=Colletotrichum destructivum TaxID=34406 RepID=A0AAX4ILN3_9PEZI|nr:hypothetical protein CDEST_09243 [Colletotrichum destructivum]